MFLLYETIEKNFFRGPCILSTLLNRSNYQPSKATINPLKQESEFRSGVGRIVYTHLDFHA